MDVWKLGSEMITPSLNKTQTPDCVNLNTNQTGISRSTLHPRSNCATVKSKYRTTCIFVQRLYMYIHTVGTKIL